MTAEFPKPGRYALAAVIDGHEKARISLEIHAPHIAAA